MSSEHGDPRPARSRARLLEAATDLLRSGGPSAVTVDAVIRASNVARATLYRHYASGNDLLAAAFHALIPPAPVPLAEGDLRERLIARHGVDGAQVTADGVGYLAPRATNRTEEGRARNRRVEVMLLAG